MMWSSTPSEEKLHLWKKFRAEIKDSTLDDKLTEVAKFCGSIPYGARTLDYYSPKDWPTPWEILFHNSFCTSSISLLMFYTLTLADPTIDIELLLVEDNDGLFLLPVIENQYILNYELSKVSNYSEVVNSFKVMKRHTKDSIKILK